MSSSRRLLKLLGPKAFCTAETCAGGPFINGRTDGRLFVRGLHLAVHKEDLKRDGWRSGVLPRRLGDVAKDARDKEELAKVKTGGHGRKMDMKDWSERSPAWLSREHDESDLVKHIEVLQRFADRYNAASSHRQLVKNRTDPSDRKTLVNMLDKPPNKKFSTLVRARGGADKKRKDSRRTERQTGQLKTFITLADEPRSREPLKPKPKPPVPAVKHLRNPDSIRLSGFSSHRANAAKRPRIYSILNPKLKNKEYEAYLKKTFPALTNADKQPLKQKKQEATVGDYFSNRYVPKCDVIQDKKGRELTQTLKEGLLERRRTLPVAILVKPEPKIHSKTSLLVQKTHLPLTKCKNIKQKESPRETPGSYQIQNDLSSSPAQNTLLNRIIKYFKR